MPEPTVIRTINEYRAALLAQEARQMVDMARRWQQVEDALGGRIDALAQDVAARRAAGEVVKEWRLVELERYRSLLAQARVEIERYVSYANDLITERQRSIGGLGIEQAAQAIRAIYGDAGAVVTGFNILPTEAIESMAGLTASGSPLRSLLEQAWPDSVEGMTRELIDATAQGVNPRRTARRMANGLTGGLDRCLTIARTEQLRVYREAARQQYIASGVVDGYRRICAKQMRTCLACLLMDGTIYALEDSFEDHPNGRCTSVPNVVGLDPVQWKSGSEWFKGLSADQQRSMMGKGLYDAWSSGKVSLDKLVRTHSDPTWGDHPRLATLAELGVRAS